MKFLTLSTSKGLLGSLLLAGLSLAPSAQAISLNASTGGTFTFNYDSEALGNYVGGSPGNPGFFLTKFWNTADSNYLTKDIGFFQADNDFTADTSNAFAHDLMPVSTTNPAGQAAGRFVKSTTTNFAINSDTLTGAGILGMTGVQGFRLPFYESGTTGLYYGDFGLRYGLASRQLAWDDAGLTGTATGWYMYNYLSFGAVAYDLANLSVTVTDANNWKLSGDLLMSPENGLFLSGAALTDVGNFCLGVGSFAGCSNPVSVSAVPVPAAVWLFGSAIAGLIGISRRNIAKQTD